MELTYDDLEEFNETNSTFMFFYIQSLETLKHYRKMNLVLTCIFTILGLIGHFLTMFVFFQKRFRKNSSNVFLLCLAVNDALYLVIHFFEDTVRTLIHLNEDYALFNVLNLIDKNNTTCRLINYFRYVLRFISAYIIVAFSLQRSLVVCAPLSSKFKSTKSAWHTVLVISILALIINLWVPFIYENKTDEAYLYCDVRKEWTREYFHITLVYICLIMLIPIVIIFASNTVIISNILRHVPRGGSVLRRSTKKINHMIKSSNRNFKLKPYYLNMNQMITRITNKANSRKKLTKILILITFSYAFLNLPYFIAWLLYYFEIILNRDNFIRQNYLYAGVELAKVFYILNYSIYFYIYCASGSVFRNQLKYSSKPIIFKAYFGTNVSW